MDTGNQIPPPSIYPALEDAGGGRDGIPLFGNPFPVRDRQRGVSLPARSAPAEAGGDFRKNMSSQLWTD